MTTKPKIAIVFYTTYLHSYKLAKAIEEGIEKDGSCFVNLFQIPETLGDDILKKMQAPPKPEVPMITPELLKEFDGILFGYPTRYGTLPSQLKDFIDSCGQLWASGSLNGKMAGGFVSTATQHGGQESSILNLISTFVHFGMIYVPLGYGSPHLNEDQEMIGGSPWGASVIAGRDGSRQPSEKELEIARVQGERFSKTLGRYHGITLKRDKNASLSKEEKKEDSFQNSESNLADGLSDADPKKKPPLEEKDTIIEEVVIPTSPNSVPLVQSENKAESPVGTAIDSVNSKDSTATNKSTSGLKKLFKRISNRPKPETP